MKAIILAAGDGVRLRPLTATRPKPMLCIAGKPLIHHLLLEAKKAGIAEAIIIVRHLKEQIIDYFNKTDIGMKIKCIEQKPGNGTATAILSADGEVNDTFVVLAGDIVTDSSVIKSVIDGHTGNITLAVKKVSNPHEYGVVELSGDNVSLFEEKPKHPKTDLANLSVYCMQPTIFNEIKSLTKSERGEYEIVDLFVGAKAVIVDGYWRDIAYPWDLFEANEFLISKMEVCKEHIENSTIEGKVIMGDGAKIIDSYIEGNSYIGAGSVIGPNAYLRGTNSIGKNCSIGGGTTLKNSILFDNVNAKHLAYIGDSVIGSNVNFGSGTQVANYRFDGGHINVLTEKGWVNSGKNKLGVFVGDNTKFGVLSCTMPGKLIGHNCWVYSGVVVNKNVPPNMKVYTRQQIEFAKMEE
ncbi:NTP transferase domain-containing protein [Candidatus Micrarchaeota archaeon]|nr:NTP transferase domain-containing protein [Candidatus Micrarchaeota archaeon]MBU1166062.1 NTP transferase domain-containing protein [Candidatus Micrarchaeota archaeon]MBU1886164.1 NTP transferase domain-containing protein [Candidatus Micrarchaeota archaeon]